MASVKQPSTLSDLPVEILLWIAELLSPASSTCLALCNRRLMSVFAAGGLLKHRLQKGEPGDLTNERPIFLTRLSFDIPAYYVCSICLQLHLWRTFPLPALFRYTKCFHLTNGHDRYWWLGRPVAKLMWPSRPLYEFHFTHLQLAMRRFYHGPKYGVSTDSLFYVEVTASPCDDTTSPSQKVSASTPEERAVSGIKTVLSSFEARICPTAPSLCLRVQVWSVVKRQNASALSPEKDYVWFCGHIKIEHPNSSDHVRFHISAYCSGSPKAAEYWKCSKCNTEWRIEMRDFGGQEVSLIMTRWFDLRAGLSPQDPRWRSHVKIPSQWDVAAEDIVDSSRLRFETSLAEGGKSETLSDEELYSRNASLLKGRRYMDVMEKISGASEWCMRPDSPRRRSSGCIVL